MAKVKLTIDEPDETLEPLPPDADVEASEAQTTQAARKEAPAAKATSAKKGAAEPASAEKGADEAEPAQGLAAYFSKVAPAHEHAVLGGIMGLIVAVLMFVVGFWRTLFVVVMVTIGIALGQYLDGNPKIINFIRRVIAEFRGN